MMLSLYPFILSHFTNLGRFENSQLSTECIIKNVKSALRAILDNSSIAAKSRLQQNHVLVI